MEYTAADLHDASRVTITGGDIVTDLSIEGHLTQAPEYEFRAKVYDAPSPYGIDGGRVSKLDVFKGDAVILDYQRGWAEDRGPETHTPEQKKVLAEIQAGFPPVEQKRERAQPATHEHTVSLGNGRGRGGR